jgi:SulP family sulfate permease
MIPESLSFAILAGFPLVGFICRVYNGYCCFGGRPGMVSGGAGATVIVLIALMKSSGLEYVFAAVTLAGIAPGKLLLWII